MKHNVVRLGAAAFAAGLSLMAPLPAAGADTGVGTQSGSVEARSGSSERTARPNSDRKFADPVSPARPVVGRRADAGLRSAPVSRPRAGSVHDPAAGVAAAELGRNRVRSSAAARSAGAGVKSPANARGVVPPEPAATSFEGRASSVIPDTAVLSAVRTVATAATAAPAAAGAVVHSCALCDGASSAAARRPGGVVGGLLTGVAFGVERLIDRLGVVLSRFPANPVTDLLSGGLWLVRRTLFPVGADVGLWGSAACVATKDCSGQDLTGADFTLQDLAKVNFTNAVLKSAILRDAELTEADLTGASLQGANFYRATLVDANLSGVVASAPPRQVGTFFAEADLTAADLTGAELARSWLFRANLTDADLTGADLAGAVLAGVTWKNTTCPDGSKSDTGCSGSAPAAEAVFGPLVAGVGRVLSGVAAGVDRVLGAASQGLSGFPGAVASVIVGALDLVRRSLRDSVVGLPGWSVSGTSVEIKNRTDQILVVLPDADGIRGGQTGPKLVFLSPGETGTFSGYHSDDDAVDVLLSVNLTKKIGDDTIATDETRMILVANNEWISTPVLRVEAVDPPSLQAGKNLNRGYLALRPGFFGLNWWELSEGEDCHCDAVNSGGPADGPQVYVARRDDSDDYKNFYVEIFSVGAVPTGGGKDMYQVNEDALYYCNGKGAKSTRGGGTE